METQRSFSETVKVEPGGVGDPRVLEMREPGMSAYREWNQLKREKCVTANKSDTER